MQTIKIGNHLISESAPAFIIAEAGVNHNGDLNLAMKLVDEAVAAKADAVKFQSFCTDELIEQNVPKAEYQKETTHSQESQSEMLRRLELSFDEQTKLKKYCEDKGIIFLSTPFDLKSFYFLESIDVIAHKISSTDTNNPLFIKKVAQSHKPIILSTGMSTLSDVELAVQTIRGEGNEQIAILHCTAAYPTHPKDCNLQAIVTLKHAFKTIVGYSDHTEGIGVAPYTIPLGSKVIEKHFTLDKNMEGPDHKASLNPIELKEMIQQIRMVELAMGTGIKLSTDTERMNQKVMQKKLFFRSDLRQGEIIHEDMLTAKRAGNGISANLSKLIIGQKLVQNVLAGEAVKLSKLDLEGRES